jgi:hypothetical protein
VNPNMCKEDIGGVLGCDALLVGCQNCHLGELINEHEDIVIPMLG